MEQRIYDCTLEVKQIVMAIEKLCCNVIIERDYGGNIDLKKYAEMEAKGRLKENIDKFILTEEKEDHTGQKYIKATINLPYVYDAIMKAKDKQVEDHFKRECRLKSENGILKSKVEWLELPWYKKLLARLKND